MPFDPDGTGKSILAVNEEAEIDPEELVFLKIEILFVFVFATNKSDFPSPSISDITTKYGNDPVVKSTFDAKDEELIICEFGNVTIKGSEE